ncbi:MAG: endolytic transglycosylase MltG [candidate division Zixibacteria bacterium]|nr:endolytic transglycosylase MltG [candidate division Zixibacteria bacterium]
MWWRLLIAVLLIAAISVGSVFYLVSSPIHLSQPVRLVVRKGETMGQVTSRLDSLGLLRSRRAFVLWAKRQKIDRQLKPGRYEFSGDVAMGNILASLQAGPPPIKVTIPEGWTLQKIAPRLSRELGVDSAEFIRLAHDSAVLNRWGVPSDRLEGYLLPETYEFYWGEAPVEVVERMLQNNRAVFADSLERRMRSMNLSRHAILTLASMIEAETADSAERPHIASVFYNRLRLGMPMQCDPTVVYAMGGLPDGRSLLSGDLEFASPYNTYQNPGLPPGPICNPGRASILAALYPDSTSDLYFVSNGMGRHIFSRTLDEHNTARQRVRRMLNSP